MTRKYIDNAFHHNTPLSALKFAKDKKKANCKLSYSAILWHSPQPTPKIQLTTALLRETGKESEMLNGLRQLKLRRERLPTQYSGLENAMVCIVHGVAKSWTRLIDFHFLV